MQRPLRGGWHCIRNGRENGLTFIHYARYQGMLGPQFQDGVAPMYAQSTERELTSYSDQHPVLIAADDDAALARARRAIETAGLRIAEVVGTAAAAERVGQQPAASAIWLELSADSGAATDRLVQQVVGQAAEGRHCAIISVPNRLLDAVAAQASVDEVELLVDADDVERLAALSLALVSRHWQQATHDAASDKSAARLRQLSDEVSRIATTLARLSTGPSAIPRGPQREPTGEVPEVSAETVRAVIRARRLRARYFSEDLFADPAWDMLLDLYAANLEQRKVSTSELCIASAVPSTTALRWIEKLVQMKMVTREDDHLDGRRTWVSLSPAARLQMESYFDAMAPSLRVV